jgi:hypothetical protein
MLSQKDIEEYQFIYQKVYQEELSYQEAFEQAHRLLKFFKVITKPILSKKIEQIK